MEVFNSFPTEHICPVCGTNNNGQTIMVPIDNLKHKDGLSHKIPTHLLCILTNIRYSRSHQLMGLEAKEEISSEY